MACSHELVRECDQVESHRPGPSNAELWWRESYDGAHTYWQEAKTLRSPQSAVVNIPHWWNLHERAWCLGTEAVLSMPAVFERYKEAVEPETR